MCNTMFVKLYLIALPVFITFDLLWLGLVAKNFYQEQVGFLMRSDVNLIAATLFYLVFVAGLVLFVIYPAQEKGSMVYALMFGAAFGLVTYASFDLTSLALIKGWPILVTVIDMLWGMFIAASVSAITCFIVSKI